MKNLVITIFILIVSKNFAQINYSKYYPLQVGTTIQYNLYDERGDLDGTSDYKITHVKNNEDETVVEMTVNFTNSKKEEALQSSYNIYCAGNGIKIDFKSLIPSEMLAQYKKIGMAVDLSGNDIEIPNDLSVGQLLEDANVIMNARIASMNIKTVVNIMNRKVEKEEKLTTPVGSFDCIVIFSENESQIRGKKKVFSSRLWLAEGVGTVKQETYEKNGDLINTTELIKFVQ